MSLQTVTLPSFIANQSQPELAETLELGDLDETVPDASTESLFYFNSTSPPLQLGSFWSSTIGFLLHANLRFVVFLH